MSPSATPAPRDVIALLSLPGVGSATVERVLGSGLTGEELTKRKAHVSPGLVRPGAARSLGDSRLVRIALEQADQEIARAEKQGVMLVTLWDEAYPWLLRLIPHKPVLLYLRGHLPRGRFKAVAIVGTRTPSDQAKEGAYALASFLASQGFAIVSGLALGIDTASHRGGVDVAGSAIAVLGGGLGSISPKANRGLADEILATGGALISEQPIDRPATSQSLVRRNRLQSGMSLATIVVQSAPRGGSMHTAAAAKAQRRKLYCAATYVDAEEFKAGAFRLISKLGAKEVPATGRWNQIVVDLRKEAKRWEAVADEPRAGCPDTGSPERDGQLSLPFSNG